MHLFFKVTTERAERVKRFGRIQRTGVDEVEQQLTDGPDTAHSRVKRWGRRRRRRKVRKNKDGSKQKLTWEERRKRKKWEKEHGRPYPEDGGRAFRDRYRKYVAASNRKFLIESRRSWYKQRRQREEAAKAGKKGRRKRDTFGNIPEDNFLQNSDAEQKHTISKRSSSFNEGKNKEGSEEVHKIVKRWGRRRRRRKVRKI